MGRMAGHGFGRAFRRAFRGVSTESCYRDTDICMRTTLDLDDRVLQQAKRHALDQGETLTRFIERAIRAQLAVPAQVPAFRLSLLTKKGKARPDIDWDDRDSIYEHMEDDA